MSTIEKTRITIVVSGGFVDEVFVNPKTDLEVDIIDLDDELLTDEERAERNAYCSKVRAEQYKLY